MKAPALRAALRGAARLPRPPRVPRVAATLPTQRPLPPMRPAPLDVLVVDPFWIALGDDADFEGGAL